MADIDLEAVEGFEEELNRMSVEKVKGFVHSWKEKSVNQETHRCVYWNEIAENRQ